VTPRSTRRALSVTVALAVAGTVAVSSGPAYAADGGDVNVVNTETIQVYTSPTGDVQTRRVYEQLALTGKGSVTLENPVSTHNLRNLDGFSGFDVKGGDQITKATVDGQKRLRSVSDYDGKLPLDVSVAYKLDGKNVKPGDVVGKDGKLEVQYTVENITGTPQEVSIPDGKGGTVTKTVDVPIPMVGSVDTVAPSNFTNVKSGAANMAGDGEGGTKLSFTMTLFPPIGKTTAVFGYSANIKDGVVPRTEISALPVNPLQSPTFASAAGSYKGGADTGAELADGATTIDTNLLKLRDGAGDLLAGLIKLREGADQLNDGLSNDAAPGSKKLATGAEDLSSGMILIDKGTHRLADGTGDALAGGKKLDNGAKRLATGLKTAGAKAPALIGGLGDLRDGLVLVDNGLRDLSRGVGGINDDPKYGALQQGIKKLLDGVGSKSDTGTLTWAVDQVRSGLTTEAVPGLDRLSGGATCASVVVGAVINGQGPLAPGANPCFPSGFPGLPALDTNSPLDAGRASVLSRVRAGINDPGNVNPDPTLVEGLAQLKSGLVSQDPNDPGAITALATVECALDSASLGPVCDAVRPGQVGLAQGLQQVSAGVPLLVGTIIKTVQDAVGRASDTPKDGTLRGGMSGLIGGADQLSGGGGDLVSGLGLLADGSGDLADGTGELRSGLGTLDAGANTLADGTTKAADGSTQLKDGANTLSDGLGDAADGSGQIADGLKTAAGGAPKLVDGAQELSTQGTKKLIGAGTTTAQSYGELYATMVAGSKRAQTEDMAFGAPKDAVGLTAYSYIIKGDDGEGGKNLTRGLGGLALLGAGAGVFALRRRLV
jgi:putative membrane protein